MRHVANTTLTGALAAVVLRPSLRAAASLESRYGFQKLFASCADGNLGVMADIIEASSDTRDFLKSIGDIPLIEVMPSLLQAMPSHILALAGIDPDTKSDVESGESIPFADYYARLFRIGTGWLGWLPAVTWEATAPEIVEAYTGHLEKLRAIHGGKEDEPTATDKPENAVFDRAGLNKLKAMGGSN